MNMAGLHDMYGFALAGGLKGGGLGVTDIHLLPQRLILDVTAIRFGTSTITSYSKRAWRPINMIFPTCSSIITGSPAADSRPRTSTGCSRFTAAVQDRIGAGQDPRPERDHAPGDPGLAEVEDRHVRGGRPRDLTDDYYDPGKGQTGREPLVVSAAEYR